MQLEQETIRGSLAELSMRRRTLGRQSHAAAQTVRPLRVARLGKNRDHQKFEFGDVVCVGHEPGKQRSSGEGSSVLRWCGLI